MSVIEHAESIACLSSKAGEAEEEFLLRRPNAGDSTLASLRLISGCARFQRKGAKTQRGMAATKGAGLFGRPGRCGSHGRRAEKVFLRKTGKGEGDGYCPGA